MSTYVIGDIHGCYTQFTELRERIERKDAAAVFVLVGDIVGRGAEDEKMLAWAYGNITAGGKYQMVLGNHDDGFMEVFGNGDFETIYTLGAKADRRYNPPTDEFWHLKKDKDLMYKYAEFLSKQPLIKKIEVNGRKYVIAHAWHEPAGSAENVNDNGNKDEAAFQQRFCLLWKRDREENGRITAKYAPTDGEKLVHGHSPTIGEKHELYRGYSPGKVWDMGASINVDCGLVYNLTKRSAASVKYGNLAAYNLETGEAEYLWNIVDEYALDDGDYYEDRREREKREYLEREQRRCAAVEKFTPYLSSFYKQVFGLDEIPAKRDGDKCCFNFLNESMYPYIKTGRAHGDVYDFDFEKEPALAMTTTREKDKADRLYLYFDEEWHGVDLDKESVYAVFEHKGKIYLLGANHYSERVAEVTVDDFCDPYTQRILSYRMTPPGFYFSHADRLLDGDAKMGEHDRYYWGARDDESGERPTGLMTCDFHDGDELFTVKLLKNLGCQFFVRVLDNEKNVLAELRQLD